MRTVELFAVALVGLIGLIAGVAAQAVFMGWMVGRAYVAEIIRGSVLDRH